MNDTLHYDVGASVKVAPLLRHNSYFTNLSEECGRLISAFYDQLRGSQSEKMGKYFLSDCIVCNNNLPLFRGYFCQIPKGCGHLCQSF
jgi:hypothetical protein